MEYCKNAFGYVCNALINYCINACVYLDNNSLSKPKSLNDCYCNCTNQINYYRYCYNDNDNVNVNYQLFIILRVLFLCFVLCIVCGLCRYRCALHNNKKRALMSIQSYTSQAPPPYQNTSANLLQPPPIYSTTSEVQQSEAQQSEAQQSESRSNNINSSIQIEHEHVHHFTSTSNSYA